MQIDPIEESTNGYSFATTNSGDPVGFQLPIPVLIQTVAATRGDSSSSLSTVSTGACTEEAGEKVCMLYIMCVCVHTCTRARMCKVVLELWVL